MSQKASGPRSPSERLVEDIRRATREHHAAEGKIRVVPDGPRGEDGIAALCRRDGSAGSVCCSWSEESLEAGRRRLAGDTARAATTDEVKDPRQEARALEEVVAEQAPEIRLLGKSTIADGGADARGALPRRSSRSSGASSDPPCRRAARWSGSAHRPPPSTAGTITARPAARRRSGASPRAPTGSGTASPTRCGPGSSSRRRGRRGCPPRARRALLTGSQGYSVSEASVHRLPKAHDLITSPAFVVVKAADESPTQATAPDQLWRTGFTYLEVIGWGWSHLSTILGGFSRHVIAWKPCATMAAGDVTGTLELALAASGRDRARVRRRPRLPSDNGPSHVATELAGWLDGQAIDHARGAPRHPRTQGKIERWHRTPKNRILLENHYLPGDLEARIGAFVEHHDHRRYHESLGNPTPADVHSGRGQTILRERARIERRTIHQRRLLHRKQAA